MRPSRKLIKPLKIKGFCWEGRPARVPRAQSQRFFTIKEDCFSKCNNAVACQWQFQAATSLPGATNATLSLDNVRGNQAGSCSLVVTSRDNNPVTGSPPAALTVAPGTIVRLTLSRYADGSSSNYHNLPIKGAFISPSAGGAGFLLDPDGRTGGFQIPPQP